MADYLTPKLYCANPGVNVPECDDCSALASQVARLAEQVEAMQEILNSLVNGDEVSY